MEQNEQSQNIYGLSDSELDRLLDEFIKKMVDGDDDGSEHPANEPAETEETDDCPGDETTDDSTNDDELDNTDDEDDTDDDLSDDTDEDDNMDLPDDEVELNGALTVKVDILRPVKNPRAELDRLVGCRGIKERMDQLVALTKYNSMLSSVPGAKTHNVSLHSIFYGRPGTGKTTVCKIFGSLLHEAGALSKGHVVVATRNTFIGTLWGDEERAVRQVVEKARGGVLMIDEAYLFNGKSENDPGKLVIQMLLEVLADEQQRDIAIVLCGYKEPMMRLLALNPGLESRFPNRFEFTDFTLDELLEITRRRITEFNYHFTRSGWEKYKQTLAAAYACRDSETWGNARFVANQLERIYLQHAIRCVRRQPKDKKNLMALTPSDILPFEMPRQKPRMGF